MAACRAAEAGRQLWGPDTTAALKHVSAAIRETDARAAADIANSKAAAEAATAHKYSLTDSLTDIRIAEDKTALATENSASHGARHVTQSSDSLTDRLNEHTENPDNKEREHGTVIPTNAAALRGACRSCNALLKRLVASDGDGKAD